MILKKFINKIYLPNSANEAASNVSKQNQITEASSDIANDKPTIARDHCDCKQKVCIKITLNYLNQ